MRLHTISCLLFSLITISATAQTTRLKGTVAGRNSKAIYLVTPEQNLRSDKLLQIPIHNGRFEYDMPVPVMKAYELIFKDELDEGAFRPITFFPDTTEVSFVLHPHEEWEKNAINGGHINRDYYQLRDKQQLIFSNRQHQLYVAQDSLVDQGMMYSEAYNELHKRINAAKDKDERQPFYNQETAMKKAGGHLTPAGAQWHRQYDSLKLDIINWKYRQLDQNITFAGYYILMNDVMTQVASNPHILKPAQQVYQKYIDAYPDHEYAGKITDALRGLLQVFPGNPFIDFTAPDLKGKEHRISDMIRGKMALIDLWGSWCGPCIAKTRMVVPLYEQYKDKGFAIIGVAREFDNTKALLARLKQEKFNWPHLLELDDKNGIWNKYGVQNNAGLFVLVDKDGTILAIDPTPEELAKHLAKLD